ncbi:hypothetical protein [Oryzomicrobium terrae]|uniref:hypothetical protein n=1 Tax=Oryzomicrobium terrae TaxID=1735038 RepID=UPI0011F035D4|nr:hypothetical protein [Oryzomicrobium terrae]
MTFEAIATVGKLLAPDPLVQLPSSDHFAHHPNLITPAAEVGNRAARCPFSIFDMDVQGISFRLLELVEKNLIDHPVLHRDHGNSVEAHGKPPCAKRNKLLSYPSLPAREHQAGCGLSGVW